MHKEGKPSCQHSAPTKQVQEPRKYELHVTVMLIGTSGLVSYCDCYHWWENSNSMLRNQQWQSEPYIMTRRGELENQGGELINFVYLKNTNWTLQKSTVCGEHLNYCKDFKTASPHYFMLIYTISSFITSFAYPTRLTQRNKASIWSRALSSMTTRTDGNWSALQTCKRTQWQRASHYAVWVHLSPFSGQMNSC